MCFEPNPSEIMLNHETQDTIEKERK